MGMIGNIRKQSNLLIIVIALGMLLFLVPWDSFLALIGAGQYQESGEINGTAIGRVEYENQRAIRSAFFGNGVNNSQLNTSVWEDLQQKHILNAEYDKLGLSVNQEEWDAMMFGDYIPQSMQTMFYTSLGGVTDENRDRWRQNFEFWASQDDANKVQIDYFGKIDITKQARLKEKWDNLIEVGIYYNTIDANHAYAIKNDKVNIDYVFVNFNDVADSLITYTESDVKSYYNRHKNDPEFYQDRECDVEYVEFQVTPSSADTAAVLESMNTLAGEWRETTKDSLFVVNNNVQPVFRPSFYLGGELSGDEDAQILAAEPGTVLGPFQPNANAPYRLVKVLERTMQPDSAECRHILFGLQNNPGMSMDDLRNRADSIRSAIQSGSTTFEGMVTEWTDDPGSKSKGGVYDMFGRNNSFVTPFSDACFDNGVGDMVLVDTQFGVHLIEVTKQGAAVPTTRIAQIDAAVEVSENTRQSRFNEAREFALNNNTSDTFASAIEEEGMPLKTATAIRPGATTVGTLGSVNGLVQWVYNPKTSEGDISGVFSAANRTKFVVARLDKAKEAGAPPFRYVQEEMETGLTEELKAKYLVEKMSGTDLGKIAEAVGAQVKKSNSLGLSATSIPGAGSGNEEYEAVGFALGLEVGEMSTPIVGKTGIFVVAPNSELTLAGEPDLASAVTEQDQLMSSSRSGARSQNVKPAQTTGVYGALKRTANVVDNRFQY